MEVKIIDDSMKEQWEQYINRNPYSIAWQSYEWSEVLKKHFKFEFYPIVAFEGSRICGVLPLYHIKTAFSKDLLISVPYAVAGGIAADSDSTSNLLLQKAVEISEQYNSCKIILKQYKAKIDGDLQTDDNYYNGELTLSENTGEVLDKISDLNKIKIEEAEKFNLKLEYPYYDINSFYKLLLNHHHAAGVPCVSKKWIKSLVDSKMYSIAAAKRNNEIVAATMVKVFKKTVSFPFTCTIKTDDQDSSLFAYSMYWQLIQHFASSGYEIFHSGRIPRNDKTDKYRLGWGGTKYNYFYQYYPGDISKTEYSTKRGRKRELFESFWKKMPRFAINAIGPYIVKQFP